MKKKSKVIKPILLSIIGAIILAIIVVIILLLTQPKELQYICISGKEYSVTGIGTCTDTDIVIASEYYGLPVTSIGEEAFSQCSSLTSITIPSSVKNIGSWAFNNCSNLKTVTFAEKFQCMSIGKEAFKHCNGLESITIPEGTTSIGEGAFRYCEGLKSITIPSSLTSVGCDAFDNCDSLQYNEYNGGKYLGNESNPYVVLVKGTDTSNIHKDTRVIYGDAFLGCQNLESITIPSSVTSIGDDAFRGCSGLTSITIPSGVTSIGEDAFRGCNSLQYNESNGGKYLGNDKNPYVVLIEGTETSGIHPDTKIIYDHAFSGCSSLESITIPSSVTSIGERGFESCSNLKTFTFAENSQCTSIGDYAFSGCSSLESIMIPSSVKSIGGSAFWNCTGLKNVTFTKGSECESIGYGAFSNCKTLSSITFQGTKAQWNVIAKFGWDRDIGSCTIHCTDGDI